MKLKEWLLKDKMQKLAFWIIINILYIMLASYFMTVGKISMRSFSIGYIELGIINLIIGIVAFGKRKVKINVVNIFMFLIIIFGIISTIFAKDSLLALIGKDNRCEGLYSIIYYFSLMLVCGFLDKKYKKTIILCIITTGLIQCIYAILQVHDVPGIFKKYQFNDFDVIQNSNSVIMKPEIWASGFISNPNFFGTYMLICLSYVIGLLFENNTKKIQVGYFLMYILFLYGLCISKTTTCFIVFCFVILYTIFWAFKNKKIKSFLVVFIFFIAIVGAATLENKTDVVNGLKWAGEDSLEIAKGKANNRYGSNRLYIWKNTLKIVPENLLHGVGIDNYILAFDGGPLKHPSTDIIYDRAHNEYLQILITEGIFCLISYLIMYGIICIKGIKDSFKNKELYFILPIMGYLIQAFFNISVIEVAPIFYISLGLAIDNKK